MSTTLTLPLTKAQIVTKAEHYCAYQERSTYEVQNKLKSWNLSQPEIEETIQHLIEQNFLNEERFAQAYALGKFRINGWGRVKIKHALKLKKVPLEFINKAVEKIDDQTYLDKLKYLIERKSILLHEKEPYKRRQKLIQYAITKGFEQECIFDLLSKV